MKDDAPTRPLAHVKYVREKTRKQNECESVGSDVTGVFRGFSRLCFSYLLRACVRVVCVCVCVCRRSLVHWTLPPHRVFTFLSIPPSVCRPSSASASRLLLRFSVFFLSSLPLLWGPVTYFVLFCFVLFGYSITVLSLPNLDQYPLSVITILYDFSTRFDS